jgi:hypothetical protein
VTAAKTPELPDIAIGPADYALLPMETRTWLVARERPGLLDEDVGNTLTTIEGCSAPMCNRLTPGLALVGGGR